MYPVHYPGQPTPQSFPAQKKSLQIGRKPTRGFEPRTPSLRGKDE